MSKRGPWFPARGEETAQHKLTDEEVLEIRSLWGSVRKRDLAERYGVHEGTLYKAATGKTWKHLPMPGDQ